MKSNAKQADECEHNSLIWDWKGPTGSGFIGCMELVLYLMAALVLYSEVLLAKAPQFLCH